MHRSPDSRATASPTGGPGTPWWRTAVFYQVYVRSFADSDGDGVGDLAGIRERLGYLQLLGVDALWLTPFYPSPGRRPRLRRGRPARRRPALRRPRRLRRARRRRARARAQGDHRPGAEPRLGPARQLRRRRSRTRPARPGGGTSSGTAPARTVPSRRTTGSPSSAARPGPGSRTASGTCTSSPPSSPTWTGPTPRWPPTWSGRCASGWTAGWTASGSTSRTAWPRSRACRT